MISYTLKISALLSWWIRSKSMKEQIWDAKEYAKHSKGQEKWAKELITKLGLKGDEDILDLGCGDGKITALLAMLTSGEVIGVDKSETMINLAKKKYPNITFRVMDVRSLLFHKRFDVIFSNAVLHWVFEHKLVLDGLYKALKPNGKILLQFGGKGNAKTILKVMDDFIVQSAYKDYFTEFKFPYNFPHPKEYEVLLKKAGFSQFNTQLIVKDMVHESIESFKGWIRTTWFPYTQKLPMEMREQFIDEFSKLYLLAVPLDAKGKIHVDMVRLEVEVRKTT